MTGAIKGRAVLVHYAAVFNAQQEIIGDAIRIDPPARIDMQLVDDKVGFQLVMAQPIDIVLSRPEIVGVALLNEDRKFLTGLAISGDPQRREAGEVFTLKSRYIILAPKHQPS